jgi:hypothetical protein
MCSRMNEALRTRKLNVRRVESKVEDIDCVLLVMSYQNPEMRPLTCRSDPLDGGGIERCTPPT